MSNRISVLTRTLSIHVRTYHEYRCTAHVYLTRISHIVSCVLYNCFPIFRPAQYGFSEVDSVLSRHFPAQSFENWSTIEHWRATVLAAIHHVRSGGDPRKKRCYLSSYVSHHWIISFPRWNVQCIPLPKAFCPPLESVYILPWSSLCPRSRAYSMAISDTFFSRLIALTRTAKKRDRICSSFLCSLVFFFLYFVALTQFTDPGFPKFSLL